MDSPLQTTVFVLDLVQQLYQPGENLVLSPYSLISALVMLLVGSSGNSQLQLIQTLFDAKATGDSTVAATQQMQAFSQINQEILAKNEKTLAIANFIYSSVKFPLKPDFVSTLSTKLSAIAKQLNFAEANQEALVTINSDVEKITRGMIKQLLQSVEPSSRLVLVNAIYFKGAWEKPFDKADTNENDKFYLASGKTVKAAMMSKGKNWPYFEDETAKLKAVRLDYQAGGDIAMVLILPGEGVPLGTFVKSQLTGALLQRILRNLWANGKVELKMPRFKLTGNHQLASTLAKLGIKDIFTGAANLTNISPRSDELSVSEVIQQAVIEVNEEGTKAAAGTAIRLLGSSRFAPEPKVFIANRPFLYALVTKSQPEQVLFIGALEDPSKEK